MALFRVHNIRTFRLWLAGIQKFMVSDVGRNTVGKYYGFATLGITGMWMMKETKFANAWINSFEVLKINGDVVTDTDELAGIAQEEINASKILDPMMTQKPFFQKNRFMSFVTWRLESVYLGGTHFSISGVFVGFPYHWRYNTIEDLQEDWPNMREVLSQNGVDILDPNPPGRIWDNLSRSLVLSEMAKRFGIQREIQRLQLVSQTVFKPIIFMFGAGLGYTFCRFGNSALQLLKKPLWRRCLFYMATTAWLCYAYGNLVDTIQNWQDYKADRDTCSMGDAYVDGGIEYYQKSLLRNRTLAQALGSERGSKRFTKVGDDKYSFFRLPRLALSHRLNYVKDFKEEKAQRATIAKEKGL